MQEKIDSIKVGIWVDESYQPHEGGGYSYYDKLIRYLDKHSFDKRIEIVFIISTDKYHFQKETLSVGKRSILNHLLLKASTLFSHPRIQFRIKRFSFKKCVKKLLRADIDIIYYPIASQDKIPGFPFIATAWDIGHRSTYPFPEFVRDGGFLIREQFYKNELPQALLVFAESETGKKELINFLQMPEERIKVVPLFAGDPLPAEIPQQEQYLAKLNIKKNEYFFYPAQFWAHKNHITLLRAFKEIVTSFPSLKLVLSGSVITTAAALGISEKVVFPGFVSANELYTLYTNTLALVMPTFLGPTNMPLLEARELGCPILCSAHDGHQEMLQDGALYFRPEAFEEIIDKMKIILNPQQRQQIIQKSHQIQINSIFTIENAIQKIENHLLTIIPVRKTWFRE